MDGYFVSSVYFICTHYICSKISKKCGTKWVKEWSKKALKKRICSYKTICAIAGCRSSAYQLQNWRVYSNCSLFPIFISVYLMDKREWLLALYIAAFVITLWLTNTQTWIMTVVQSIAVCMSVPMLRTKAKCGRNNIVYSSVCRNYPVLTEKRFFVHWLCIWWEISDTFNCSSECIRETLLFLVIINLKKIQILSILNQSKQLFKEIQFNQMNNVVQHSPSVAVKC